MSLKFPETHRFLDLLVCDWCGHKVPSDPDARSSMTGHLAAEHPQSRYAQPAATTGDQT